MLIRLPTSEAENELNVEVVKLINVDFPVVVDDNVPNEPSLPPYCSVTAKVEFKVSYISAGPYTTIAVPAELHATIL